MKLMTKFSKDHEDEWEMFSKKTEEYDEKIDEIKKESL